MTLFQKISRSGSLRSLMMAAVVALAYGVALWGDFVFDDDLLIRDNPAVKDPSVFISSVFGSFFANTINRGVLVFFRPLVMTSYFVTYQVFGLAAWPFHLTNLLIHLLNGVLVFHVLRIWFALRPTVAFAASLLFLAHPVQTESVAWISGRTDLLAATGVLSTLILAWRWLQHGRLIHLALMAIVLHVGLLSKELCVVTPALLAVLIWIRWRAVGRWQFPLRRSAYLIVFLGLLCVHFLLWRSVALVGEAPEVIWPTGDPLTTLLTVPRILLLYLRLLVWPHPYTLNYTVTNTAPVNSPGDALFLIPLTALLLMGLLTVALLLRRHPAGAAMAWFWVCIAPVSQIRPLPVLAAEHYLYVPAVGFVALFGIGLQRAVITSPMRGVWVHRVMPLALAGLVAICVVSARRALIWHDNLRLFSHAYHRDPESSYKIINYANVLAGHGYHQEALAVLQHHRGPENLMQIELEGICLINMGRAEEGIARLERVLAADPGYSSAHNRIAEVLIQEDDLTQAESHLRMALSLRPHDDRALYLLARVQRLGGDLAAAQETIDELMRVNPERLESHLELACVQHELGRLSEAAGTLYAIHLTQRPSHESLAELARIELERGEWQGAVDALSDLVVLQPNSVDAWIDLGYAESMSGNQESAREHWTHALDLDPGNEIAQRNLTAVSNQPK